MTRKEVNNVLKNNYDFTKRVKILKNISYMKNYTKCKIKEQMFISIS